MHNEGNDFQLLCECVKISCTKNMGNLMTACAAKTKQHHEGLPLIESKDFEIIQTIWKTVEKDSAYYGFTMYTTLFKNYPQYAKYFEDESIPEFVREAKVKKKFTIIYDIIAVLFINYNVKPAQRDYLLGYIAMLHKDMGLTIQDIENFVSCIVEALCTELPQLMTPDNVIVQMKYFNVVSESMILLMEKHNTKIDEMSRLTGKDDRIFSPCFTRQTDMMYNYPLKYWLYKKRYWEYRRAVWASLEMGPAVGTAAVITDNRKMHLQQRRRSMELRRAASQRRQRSAAAKNRSSSDSDPNTEHNRTGKRKPVPGTWQLPNLLTKKLINANTAPKRLTMETIHEMLYDKTRKDRSRVENNDPPIEIQKNHEPTLSMPANPQSSKGTTASVNGNNAARERKRQRDSFSHQ
ncbi:uncharacterized protein LOC143218150 isoform X2 [Lasioglossum baleicum]|uniref:uncharacterized protein LOC143218150 isoform X2 n=1 Tax=Lasioglossum baleicum TaxID=434251 RepID=UPI003FCD6FF2